MNEIEEEIIVKDIDTTEASEIYDKENKELLNNSLVWQAFSNASDNEEFMTVAKVVRLFEDMMDLKYSQDLRDFEEKRKPKGIPEFFIEFLNRSFGLKSLAQKNIKKIIPTLLKYSENTRFLALVCRLIHINHPEPVGFAIGLFLIKVRIDFNNLITAKAGIIGKFSKNLQTLQKN